MDQFRKSIKAAFAGVPYPGDDNITKCSYQKSFGFACDECVEIADYFRGTSQHGHRVEDLRRHAAALTFLTREALHYYLPAFVLAELEDSEAADVILEHLIFKFSSNGSLSDEDNRPSFSPEQRAIMIEFFLDRREKYGESLGDLVVLAIDALSR